MATARVYTVQYDAIQQFALILVERCTPCITLRQFIGHYAHWLGHSHSGKPRFAWLFRKYWFNLTRSTIAVAADRLAEHRADHKTDLSAEYKSDVKIQIDLSQLKSLWRADSD